MKMFWIWLGLGLGLVFVFTWVFIWPIEATVSWGERVSLRWYVRLGARISGGEIIESKQLSPRYNAGMFATKITFVPSLFFRGYFTQFDECRESIDGPGDYYDRVIVRRKFRLCSLAEVLRQVENFDYIKA
jgi:hypothetical protein